MRPLFVYGILQFPEILMALLGHAVNTEFATLRGYTRVKKERRGGIIRGPGLMVSKESRVMGKLLLDLNLQDLRLIDALEERHDRTTIIVLQGGKAVAAEVYFPIDTSEYTNEPWEEEEFRTQGLSYYVNVRIPAVIRSLGSTQT